MPKISFMIKPLTSLRFFFALMVFVSHIGFVRADDPLFGWVYEHIFREGYIGVSFFFILSGFILAFNYKQKMIRREVSTHQFWVARFARIYPLFFLTVLLAIPLSLHEFISDAGSWSWRLFCNFSLIHAFFPFPEYFFSFNAPSWSISDEAFFYLMFPLIIYGMTRMTRRISCWIYIALIPLAMLIVPALWQHPLFYINPVFRLADFLLGIMLFERFEKQKDVSLFRSFKMATMLEFGAVFLFLLFFVWHQFVGDVWRYSFYYWIPMSAIIYVFAFQKGALSRVLSWPLLVLGGEISFGFYLLHQLGMRYFTYFNSRFPMLSNEYLIMALVLCGTLVASYLSHRFVEKPCNRYIKLRF